MPFACTVACTNKAGRQSRVLHSTRHAECHFDMVSINRLVFPVNTRLGSNVAPETTRPVIACTMSENGYPFSPANLAICNKQCRSPRHARVLLSGIQPDE